MLPLLLVLGCTAPTDTPLKDDTDPDPADADDDGYADDADCNDADPSVNPGAAEICDPADVDEDCDGRADSADASLVGGTPAYHDMDGDGYGDAGDATTLCELGSGYVGDDTDCADTDPAVNPGAAEVCDAADVDENCDGLADNADPAAGGSVSWFVDLDRDGFGDDATTVLACDPAAGLAETGGDCDDTDATRGTATPWYVDGDADGYGAGAGAYACEAPEGQVASPDDCDDGEAATHPAGVEICNEIDDDCDAQVDDDDVGLDLATSTTWYGDGDGDGWAGLDVSARACDAPADYVAATDATDCDDADAAVSPSASEVCSNGLDDDCDGTRNDCAVPSGAASAVAGVTFIGEDASDRLGIGVALGDPDGDGDNDVMLGAFGDDPASSAYGSVYLFTSLLGTGTTIDASAYDDKWTGTTASGAFGYSVAFVGDTDGDGYQDWVVGQPAYASGAGRALVYLGGPTLPTTHDTTFTNASGDACGYHVMGGADVDSDGLDDAATTCYGSTDEAAAVWTVADSYTFRRGRTGTFGADLALADLTGDGVGDVVVGGEDLLLFEGPIASDHTASTADDSFTDGTTPGRALSARSDLDGDGTVDLAAGDSEYVRVFAGGTATFLSAGTELHVATGASDSVAALTSADFDGDGVSDLALGCYECDEGASSGAGVVWIVYGPISADADAADGSALHGDLALDSFGWEVAAADLDGDGSAELLVGALGVDTGGSTAGAAYLFWGVGY